MGYKCNDCGEFTALTLFDIIDGVEIYRTSCCGEGFTEIARCDVEEKWFLNTQNVNHDIEIRLDVWKKETTDSHQIRIKIPLRHLSFQVFTTDIPRKNFVWL